MGSSLQEHARVPKQRRRLIAFVAIGAALVPAIVVLFRPGLYWSGPRALFWMALAGLGSFLGALLWFAGLMSQARQPMPSFEQMRRDWEAEEHRFTALRDRAANDPAAAEEYMRQLREIIEEMELIVAERSKTRPTSRGWNPEAELIRLKEDLAAAERRLGKGAA